MNHGLLAIHVLARLHGIDRDPFVPMIWRSDNDGIDIFTRQNLSVIASGKNVVAPDFLAVLEPAVITVRYGDQLHARNLQRNSSISLTLAPGTDQRNLNMIVSRNRRCRLSLRRCQREDFRSQQRLRTCGARHFQETPAIEHAVYPPNES